MIRALAAAGKNLKNVVGEDIFMSKYDFGKPFEAVESYAKGKTPWLEPSL